MSKLRNANMKIERAVVSGYRAIEDGVVSGYRALEDGFVGGYKKIEDKFVEAFLTDNAAKEAADDSTYKKLQGGGEND